MYSSPIKLAQIAAKCVRYSRQGHPLSVLSFESITLDTSSVRPSDVLVKMVAAPVTALDVAQVTGFAGAATSFPRVGGSEGLGVVEEAGSSSGLKKGDIVVASKGGVGTWSSHVIASGDSFTKVEGIDSSNTNNDAVALGASAVSPIVSAKLLLDYVTTKSGDSIVQSGADSLIGQAIVQLAVTKGLRSINIARGSPAGGWAAFSEHLQGVGATAVVSEEQAARHTFRRLLADLAPPVLGLNGTGGSSAGIVAKSLAQNATLVSYGSASASGGRSSALQVPLSLFTHKNLTLKGFSVARALETSAKTARDADVREAVASAVTGRVKLLISREPFTDFKAVLPKALAAVSSGKDNVAQRTVVLTF